MVCWLGTFTVGFFPPMLISAIGFETFWIFGSVCVLALGYAFWIPETKGKSLEQVTASFYRKVGAGGVTPVYPLD